VFKRPLWSIETADRNRRPSKQPWIRESVESSTVIASSTRCNRQVRLLGTAIDVEQTGNDKPQKANAELYGTARTESDPEGSKRTARTGRSGWFARLWSTFWIDCGRGGGGGGGRGVGGGGGFVELATLCSRV